MASDGSFFNLDIVGYQYPANDKDYHDSNWLMIQIHSGVSERSWSLKDPCLNVFDVLKLIQWLEAIARNTQKSNHPTFMEPFINFELLVDSHGNKSLQVECKHDPVEKESTGEEDISVNFPFKQINFAEVSTDLKQQLAKFPQRVFREQILIVISGLSELESGIGMVKLKEGFSQHPWVLKSALKWDPEQALLIARLVYEFQQHTLKADAKQSIKDCVSEALSFSSHESFNLFDIPA